MFDITITKLLRLAEFFKVLGDPTRLHIIYTLRDTEKCVYDIANMLEMSQSAVSHQLAVLRAARLVRNRRDGKTIFYTLDDEHIHQIITIAESHLNERN